MDKKTVENRLNLYLKITRMIENKRQLIQAMRDAQGLHAYQASEVQTTSKKSSSTDERISDNIFVVTNELHDLKEKQAGAYTAVTGLINLLNDDILKLILFKRYISGAMYKEIAFDMGYSMSYIRVSKYKAIDKLVDILNKEEGKENE